MSAKNAKGAEATKTIENNQSAERVKTRKPSQDVLSLSSKEAQEYFLLSSSYCNSVNLPRYIDFGKLLSFIKEQVGEKSLTEICCKKPTEPLVQDECSKNIVSPKFIKKASYTFFINKEGKNFYRPITLVNPYVYYFLVRDLTKEKNWTQIKNRFKELENKRCTVYSHPVWAEDKQKTNIAEWWRNVEQQSILLSINYKYMLVTDIADCYPSIYTHSIAWALMGKENAKGNRKNGLGNQIDQYIQAMQYGQTNGLPQGNEVSNLLAELILAYADNELCSKLSEENIKDYRIVRYRDDYRIFSNNKDELDKIMVHLQEVLSDLNFQLNKAKTRWSENIIETAVKQDKLEHFLSPKAPIKDGEKTTFSQMQEELMYILLFSKKHQNPGTVVKLLGKLCDRIKDRPVVEYLPSDKLCVLTAIVLEIAIHNPRTYDLAISIFSIFANNLKGKKGKIEFIRGVRTKFANTPNMVFIDLWLQRIVVGAKLKGDFGFENPLCKIVEGKKDVVLWDNSWLKEDYVKDFPLDCLCDDEKKNECSPIINADEVCVFLSSGGR